MPSSQVRSERPLTCQSPVMPGLTSSRRATSPSYRATSEGSGGRGPTRLIWPNSTLNSCGSSSSDHLRSSRPTRVTRGSSRILNIRPSVSLLRGELGEQRVGVDHHGAELEHAELPPALTDPGLPEQHRPPAVQLDGERDDHQQRQQQGQRHERQGPVDEALDQLAGAPELGRLDVDQRQPGDRPGVDARPGDVGQRRGHDQVDAGPLQLPAEPAQPASRSARRRR